MKKTNFFREMLSENGVVSSKRVNGTISYIVCLLVLLFLVWKDGGTSVVENITQTILICSMALLGISSVTSVWNGNKANVGKEEKDETEEQS